MSNGYNDSGRRTFRASGAIAQYERVKDNGDGTVSTAGQTDRAIGVAEYAVSDGEPISLALMTKQGTLLMIANAAIAAGALVFSVAAGKVGATSVGAYIQGQALTATTADGDVLEVLPIIGQVAQ